WVCWLTHPALVLGVLTAQSEVQPQPVGWDGTGWVVLLLVLAAVAALLLVCWRWPAVPLRIVLWVITHTVYRIRVFGAANIPATGPALLVCNHVTFIDWLLILASQRRFVRFLVFSGYTRHWLFAPLLRWVGAIPVDGSAGPRAIVQALRAASEAL